MSQEQIHLQIHSAHTVEPHSVSSGLSSNSRQTGQVKFLFWPTSGLMSLLKLLGGAISLTICNRDPIVIPIGPPVFSLSLETGLPPLDSVWKCSQTLKQRNQKNGWGYNYYFFPTSIAYSASLLEMWFPMEVWCAGWSVSAPGIKCCCCSPHGSITKGTE